MCQYLLKKHYQNLKSILDKISAFVTNIGLLNFLIKRKEPAVPRGFFSSIIDMLLLLFIKIWFFYVYSYCNVEI